MSRNRLDRMLRDLHKLTDDEKRVLRHEINKQIGASDHATADEINYTITQYGIPVIDAKGDYDYMAGFIGGVITAGGPQVVLGQIKRMAQWFKYAHAALDLELARANKNGMTAIVQRDASADALYDGLKEIYSGEDPDGSKATTAIVERLRQALAGRGEQYQQLMDVRRMETGKKAHWKAELAERWLQAETDISDSHPVNVRATILDEIAIPIGQAFRDEWKLKPEHEDKRQWFKSLLTNKARYKPHDYRAWLLKT